MARQAGARESCGRHSAADTAPEPKHSHHPPSIYTTPTPTHQAEPNHDYHPPSIYTIPTPTAQAEPNHDYHPPSIHTIPTPTTQAEPNHGHHPPSIHTLLIKPSPTTAIILSIHITPIPPLLIMLTDSLRVQP